MPAVPAGHRASAPVAVRTTAAPEAPALPAAPFRALVEGLSEPGAEFFSDNYVSNETSYLQVAAALAHEARPGGAFIGVGPEQNFTYIALARPSLAFILDIRRDNLVLHLLYRAIFDLAETRLHFLALLTGRELGSAPLLAADAPIELVLERATGLASSEPSFTAVHERLRRQIEDGAGIALSAADRRSLRRTHRAFFGPGLAIRFKLREASHRRYPTLGEMLAQADPQGHQLGFLASEEAFRFVQRLERAGRVVPVVGNFAGDHALSAIAQACRERGLVVSAFCVSNVEQYLIADGLWHKWRRNIEALPIDERSLFVRAYLDQGRPHPRQMKGHRTATLLQPVAHFLERQKKRPYRSMWEVSTDGVLEPQDAPHSR
ncbi:MAG: hypothetical protein HY744_27060 [Deltaproteobacteria bacterium]|nr:hypothetical protein [Deltaproteobacteria bacterium]